MGRQLHHFHNPVIRQTAAEYNACLLKLLAVLIVDLKAVAVPFVHKRHVAVKFGCLRTRRQLAGIFAKAHGAAKLLHVFLFRHQVNDTVLALRVELRRVCIGKAEHMAGNFHKRKLHAKADAEERHAVHTRIADSRNHSFGSALTEPPRNKDAVDLGKNLAYVFFLNRFGIHPFDMDLDLVADAAVRQRLRNAEVSIVQFDIFADNGYRDAFRQGVRRVHHGNPVREVGARRIQLKTFADDVVQALFPERKRNRIQKRKVEVFNDAIFRNITEQCNLLPNVVADFALRTEDDDIGLNTDGKKLFHAVLCRFRLVLVRAAQVRNQRHMDEKAVGAADLRGKLADSLKERLAFNVAHCAADLDDRNVDIFLAGVNPFLDFVCNVRDDLHGAAAVIAVPLFLNDVPVDPAGSDVAVLRQIFVDEPFIVAKVEIRFRAVVGHEHLAVLERVHRPGVNVQVRVELLHGDAKPPRFQKPAERCRGNPLSEARNDAAGHKNKFCRHIALHPHLLDF